MRYFIGFFGSMVFGATLWLLVIYFQISNKTEMSQWVWDAYAKKTQIANSIDGKKIIIVAGSNTLFGIDSKLLSKNLHLPVVNFGVNAGVYLPYTLYKAKSVIKNKDIVLMPLEYSMYNYDGEPNIQMIDYIFSRDIDAFFELSFKEQFYMIWNIPFKRVYDGYMAKGGKRVASGLYGAHNIDNYGDQINTSLRYRTKSMQKELDMLKPNRYADEFSRDALSWGYLDKFVKWCKKREVKVIFMPSTLMYFDIYKKDKAQREFYENLGDEIRKRGWIYVGKPFEYMYDKSLYLNTDFHLIDKGRKLRTLRMIEDLKESFKTLKVSNET
jgi:hypothetical protein